MRALTERSMPAKSAIATKPKLARQGPGDWINTWWNAREFVSDTGQHHPKGKIDGFSRWPTAEIAEQKAMEWLRDPRHQWAVKAGTRWLGAVLVPDASKTGG